MNPDLTPYIGGYPPNPPRLGFRYDDGGRKAAGFRNTTSDCVTRSIALATEERYEDVWHNIKEFAHRFEKGYSTAMGGRSGPGSGVRRTTYDPLLESLGWSWHPCVLVGSRDRVHMRTDELPRGRLILSLHEHMTFVHNHVEVSTYPSDRLGTRCVYGYWTPPRRRVRTR